MRIGKVTLSCPVPGKMANPREAGEPAMSAVSRIYGNIGFAGLWNGLMVRILMLGTLTGFQWLM